jgi:hypothetical protein
MARVPFQLFVKTIESLITVALRVSICPPVAATNHIVWSESEVPRRNIFNFV